MKKLLILPALFLANWASGQNLNLQTMCTAVHTQVGDTVELAAALNATNAVQSITYKFVSGPNMPVVAKDTTEYTTSILAQNDLFVTGLVVGTYLYSFTGTDKAGGTIMGTDSIIATAATACPAIPGPPVITGVSVPILGQTLTIPAGQGIKITFTYNGVTQTVTF